MEDIWRAILELMTSVEFMQHRNRIKGLCLQHSRIAHPFETSLAYLLPSLSSLVFLDISFVKFSSEFVIDSSILLQLKTLSFNNSQGVSAKRIFDMLFEKVDFVKLESLTIPNLHEYISVEAFVRFLNVSKTLEFLDMSQFKFNNLEHLRFYQVIRKRCLDGINCLFPEQSAIHIDPRGDEIFHVEDLYNCDWGSYQQCLNSSQHGIYSISGMNISDEDFDSFIKEIGGDLIAPQVRELHLSNLKTVKFTAKRLKAAGIVLEKLPNLKLLDLRGTMMSLPWRELGDLSRKNQIVIKFSKKNLKTLATTLTILFEFNEVHVEAGEDSCRLGNYDQLFSTTKIKKLDISALGFRSKEILLSSWLRVKSERTDGHELIFRIFS